MSEQELYEIARERIARRNRRWTLWAVDLAGLIISLAAVILLGNTQYVTLCVAIFLAWGGIFTLHTIRAGLEEAQHGEIENEVAKLRAATRDTTYEKPKGNPKHLMLGEDGELTEVDDEELNNADAQRSRNS